jgi:hypothetical protein
MDEENGEQASNSQGLDGSDFYRPKHDTRRDKHHEPSGHGNLFCIVVTERREISLAAWAPMVSYPALPVS